MFGRPRTPRMLKRLGTSQKTALKPVENWFILSESGGKMLIMLMVLFFFLTLELFVYKEKLFLFDSGRHLLCLCCALTMTNRVF